MSRVSLLVTGYIFLTILFGVYAQSNVGFVSAQTPPQGSAATNQNTPPTGSAITNQNTPPPGTAVTNQGNQGSKKLENPLQSRSIEEFLLKIIEVILVFAIPIIILFIMYAGFLFVTARGNPGQIETARSALLWSIVGGVIILGAQLIIQVIKGTVSAF